MEQYRQGMYRLIVGLALPLVLIMGVVRCVTLGWYPAWEYARPDFPLDPLGMPAAERLRLAQASIAFLNAPGDSVRLSELRFADGQPAFNERELRHMDDVKAVYAWLTQGAAFALLLAGLAGWVLWRDDARQLWRTIAWSGLATLALLVGLAVWMAVGFEAFFTAFHGVFFTGDTWLFAATDTLIRLFPLPFWEDGGMVVAAGVGILAAGLSAWGIRQARS